MWKLDGTAPDCALTTDAGDVGTVSNVASAVSDQTTSVDSNQVDVTVAAATHSSADDQYSATRVSPASTPLCCVANDSVTDGVAAARIALVRMSSSA